MRLRRITRDGFPGALPWSWTIRGTFRRALAAPLVLASILTAAPWAGGAGAPPSEPAASAVAASPPAAAGAPPQEALLRWWREHPAAPAEYLAAKFGSYRWVFLGEYHRIRHDVELVSALIPMLHQGTPVRRLALEFLCSERTEEANALVTAPDLPPRRAMEFFRSQFPDWPYREYVDILGTVHDSNRRHAADRGPFLLVGLNPCPRWEVVHYGDAAAAAAERRKRQDYDGWMARALEEGVLRPGLPALVYTGIAHATGKFTEYVYGTDRPLPRMGNLVYHKPYREGMFFVALHAPFFDSADGEEIYPFDGVLDRLMLEYGRDIGFDVIGTPFAGLQHAVRSPRSITAHAFGDLYDGYVIYRTPMKEYPGVSCIPDWVRTEEERRFVVRNLPNKAAGEEQAALPLDEYLADRCAPRPDHGDRFRRRFRRLPDLAPPSSPGSGPPSRR